MRIVKYFGVSHCCTEWINTRSVPTHSIVPCSRTDQTKTGYILPVGKIQERQLTVLEAAFLRTTVNLFMLGSACLNPQVSVFVLRYLHQFLMAGWNCFDRLSEESFPVALPMICWEASGMKWRRTCKGWRIWWTEVATTVYYFWTLFWVLCWRMLMLHVWYSSKSWLNFNS